MRRIIASPLLLAWVAVGCGAPGRPSVSEIPAQCSASGTADDLSTLLVEWDAAAKTALESALASGTGIAVRFNGCSMEVLHTCQVLANYKVSRVTPKRQFRSFSSRQEIYAKAPLGAANLAVQLGRNRSLELSIVTVAEHRLVADPTRQRIIADDCDGVTHIVAAVTKGAYSLNASAARQGGVAGGYKGAELGASGSTGSKAANQEGEVERCSEPAESDRYGADCTALISVELTAVEDPAEVRSRTRCDRGMIFVADPSAELPVQMEDAFAYGAGVYNDPNYRGGFCLDREEVRAQDYRACVRDDKCMDLPATARLDDLGLLGLDHDLGNKLCVGSHAGSGAEPVNCVDLAAARAYCDSVGKRLPTFDEWSLAATGNQGRLYPWGQDEPTNDHANACNKECAGEKYWLAMTISGLAKRRDGASGPAPVGRYSKGDGRQGIRDLAGNVAEWTADGSIRGGSFLSSSPQQLRSLAFDKIDEASRRPDVGFRCASDPLR